MIEGAVNSSHCLQHRSGPGAYTLPRLSSYFTPQQVHTQLHFVLSNFPFFTVKDNQIKTVVVFQMRKLKLRGKTTCKSSRGRPGLKVPSSLPSEGPDR